MLGQALGEPGANRLSDAQSATAQKAQMGRLAPAVSGCLRRSDGVARAWLLPYLLPEAKKARNLVRDSAS